MTEFEIFRDFTLGENQAVKVLLIEQDEDYAEIIKTLLKRDNVEIEYVKNAPEGLDKIQGENYDLVILNARQNALNDEITLLEQIRRNSVVPIIALNEMSEEEAGVNMVLEGADYDLQKPFTPRRLRAAVTAVLRRSEVGGLENTEPMLPEMLQTGGLTLSLGRLEATVNNNAKPISLSAREFSLLQFLMTNPNRAFTREELAARAWGWASGSKTTAKAQSAGEMRAIDSTIKRLRSKIEEDTRNPRYIVTERNVGYRFVAKEEE